MSYFIPSFIQKRILRYALSRLELLDTDALGLENLDITWGKKSTVELKDIGIRTKKLAALLQLPKALSISRANIALLRLTIPSDLHQSSISIEIEDVDLQVKVDLEHGDDARTSSQDRSRTYHRETSMANSADRSRSTPYQVHDPGGNVLAPSTSDDSDSDDDLPPTLPTSEDLAQSFLYAEPQKEREELRAALLQSQKIEQSRTSEQSATGQIATGVGIDISLPAFLADFLSGIVDRMQFLVTRVRIDIDLKLQLPPTNLGSESSARSESVTFRILISETRAANASTSDIVGSQESIQESHPGPDHASRNISARGIEFMLVSESSLFTHVAQSPVPSSPGTTHGSTSAPSTSKANTPPMPTLSPSREIIDSSEVEDGTEGRHYETLGDSILNGVDPKRLLIQDLQRFPTREECTRPIPDMASSDSHMHVTSDTLLSSDVGDLLEQQHAPRLVEPRTTRPRRPEIDPILSFTAMGNSPEYQDTRPRCSPPASFDAFSDPLDIPSAVPVSVATKLRRPSTSPLVEDLTESRLFTHEEASSMYMSATSQMDPETGDSSLALPGQWQSAFPHKDGAEFSSHHSLPRTPESASKERSPTPKPIISGFQFAAVSSGDANSRNLTQETSSRHHGSSQTSSTSGVGSDSVLLVKRIAAINVLKITLTSEKQNLQRKEPSDPISSSIQTTAMHIDDVQVVGDMTLTKLAILAVQQISSSLQETQSASKRGNELKVSATSHRRTNCLVVQTLSWKFLEVVRGKPLSKDSVSELAGTTSIAGDADVLLRAEIGRVYIDCVQTADSSTMKVKVGKINFGYEAADILSFDPALKLRDSSRDILAPVNADLALTFTKSNAHVSIDVTTLPISVFLDLRKLDETFNWFGGLSSMLGLGSSMVSTITLKDNQRTRGERPAREHGVHFEHADPLSQNLETSSSRQSKVTVRVGGLVFDVQATHAALRFESTAMKLVSRAEGIGIQIDRLRLKGPYVGDMEGDVSMLLNLLNLRVEYLPVPKEIDLARLIELVSPSQLKDQDAFKDGLMVDTMLRQRRKGGVLRITVDNVDGSLSNFDDIHQLSSLTQDLNKLSTVAKYLPQDDRPGILVLALLRNVSLQAQVDENFGTANLKVTTFEAAQVTFPTLAALGIRSLSLDRNEDEELISSSVPWRMQTNTDLPMILARFIGNEMDPTVRVRVHGLCLEYHVSTIMALMGLKDEDSGEELMSEMVNSAATLIQPKFSKFGFPKASTRRESSSKDEDAKAAPPGVDLVVKDTVIGLNPRHSPAKGYIILDEAQITSSVAEEKQVCTSLEIRKASMMVINDMSNIAKPVTTASYSSYTSTLTAAGFVSVSTLSAVKAKFLILGPKVDRHRSTEAKIDGGLVILETCADSTQTLQQIFSGLSPPTPKSTQLRYRTEAVPIEDMLASFTGDAYAMSGRSNSDGEGLGLGLDDGDLVNDDVPQNLEFVSSFYNPDPEETSRMITDSMLEEDLDSIASPSLIREIGDKNLLESFDEQVQVAPGNAPLDFREDHFKSKPSANRFSPGLKFETKSPASPSQSLAIAHLLKVQIRGFHVIWNLFDGYDWQHTRDTISQAVADVQSKANDRFSGKNKRKSLGPQDEDGNIIGDFLFNSIYIGVPANSDPADLARQVNHNIDDLASETGSYATTTTSESTARQGRSPGPKGRKLRLQRSKYHKMTFELRGVSGDCNIPPVNSGGVQSAIDIRIEDLEIFDHVPTSTWKKFATYMHDAGERESGTSMIHIEIKNVKPVPDLAASEIVLKATVLPLRLHVDQDALDFMSRFFEFKDDSRPSPSAAHEAPFLQRVEVNSIRVKLDFKPKRVDYAGLRSGHTTEFMNFFILDRADMVLRHVIIYGISGFDRLGKTLNDIWMPDIKNNQLPGILAGLGPIRSLVNVGGGVRDLVVLPIREYQKDGRVVRSFQKGALAFAKTTTSELVKLGAKLAIGTQTVLQGAEDMLNQQDSRARTDISGGWDDAELDAEEKDQISLYSNQPVGVIQGLRGAYASLERDLLTTKDVIIAMPGEIMESGSATGAAKTVLKSAPTVILKPAIGVSKAVGQTLLGATNSLDPGNRRRVEDKYKRH